MDIKLEGKRTLVTGAGKGIGRAVCKKLVEYGAVVYALSRTKEDLDSLQTEVPKVHVILVDLVDWDRTREEISRIGPLDLLVNNAGVIAVSSFLETSKENLDSIVDINFKAAFNVAQVVAKGMVQKGTGGVIVNLSSICSTVVHNNLSVYCSSKAAFDMLTECMAQELGPKNIRVNSVNPTVVWTPMTLKIADELKNDMGILDKIPLGHAAELEDVVNLVVFLLSDRSAMITGSCIKLDGGLAVHGCTR